MPTPLVIDHDASLHSVPDTCFTKPIEGQSENCAIDVPLKEKGGSNPTHYLRYTRQKDHFVLSEQNTPEEIAWVKSFEPPSQASVDSYVSQLLSRLHQPLKARPILSADPEGWSRWQAQAAVELGGVFEKGTESGTEAALGMGFGLRYFNPKYLGPVDFGLGMQSLWYWNAYRADPHPTYDFNSLTVSPSVGLRIGEHFLFDVAAGPLFGTSEPVPNSGRKEFTAGATLQANLGFPVLNAEESFGLDMFNLSLSLLARPNDKTNPLGGSFLVGINPIGIVSAFVTFFGMGFR